jgi:hypothetical protein
MILKGNAKVLLMNEIPFTSHGFDITPGFSNAQNGWMTLPVADN